ncbi:MAG: glycine cleavage system H protein [Acidimicrobiales bacterium]
MNVPDDLQYSSDHEWIRVDGNRVIVGITDYAQDALGDVVYVQVPDQGATVAAGAGISEVESTKSVSDIYAPVAGTIVEVNGELEDARRSSTATRTAMGGSASSRSRTPAPSPGCRRRRLPRLIEG